MIAFFSTILSFDEGQCLNSGLFVQTSIYSRVGQSLPRCTDATLWTLLPKHSIMACGFRRDVERI